MSERPHSRKRNDSGKTGSVNKRGSGLGGGPSGNSSRNSSSSGSSSNRSKTITRAGGGGLIGLIVAGLFFMLGGGNLLGGGTTSTSSPAVTSSPPISNVSQGASSGYFFGSPVTNNVTYTDASTSEVITTVDSSARDKYTTILGNGNDEVTIMVYMCGTDLESNYGMATSDMNEMIGATLSDNVNIVVETGGTKRWKNNVMTSGITQYWEIVDDGIVPLNQNVGKQAMTDPNTLANFIQFCKQNYPANRYMLIFWDHGGGSVAGYGYDELYPNSSMTLNRMAQALEAGGTKFDIIGFDACLMATLETAMVLEPYADYLLASEETEPGTGWYYTEWLTKLAKNPSMSSLDIGKNVIDDFVAKKQNGASRSDKNTLSLIDLAELKATVPSALTAFSKTISSAVTGNQYQSVADARSVTREFGQSQKLDQIDLIHFCNTLNTKEAQNLANALSACIKYNRSSNVTNAFGISIYFPYRNTRRVSTAVSLYDSINFDSEYSSAIRSFATLQSSGQIATNSTSSTLFDLLGGSGSSNGQSLSGLDLYSLLSGGTSSSSSSSGASLFDLLGGSSGIDSSALNLFSSFIGKSMVDSEDLVLTENNGRKVLSLSKEDWALIQTIKLNVWVDDGSGYIDLGLDNIFEFDEDGNLIISYDGMWLALNDQVTSYYLMSDEYVSEDDYTITGYIPAMLNGEEVHLIVTFTDENPKGEVLGAEKIYDLGTDGRLLPIQNGDQIDIICDYYDYDGNFSDRYYLGETIYVSGDLEISDITVSADRMLYSYTLTDIYNSDRYTPMVEY